MSSEPASSELPVGAHLQQGKYRLDQVLKQSESLLSYKATHRGLDQVVIVQTLRHQPGKHSHRASVVQRFIAAAQKVAKVHHPHLVHVNDLFVERDLPFMVTDHHVGASLEERVAQQPIPELQALTYIRQVGAVLSALHRHHCLHGGLHPAHLILQQNQDLVLLTDLGIGRELTPGAVSTHLRGYAAPEQYRPSHGLTPAVDVYALAAILYRLLTGHHPISGASRQQTPLPPPRQFCPQLNVNTERAILSGMAIKASDRPQSVEQWLSLLSSTSNADPPTTKLQIATALPLQQPFPSSPPVQRSPARSSSSPAQHSVPAAPQVSLTPPATHPPETNPPKTMPARFKSTSHPRFPIRALCLSGGIAGMLGLGCGFVLRFNYLTQFAPPQISTGQSPKVQRESFPPRPASSPSEEPGLQEQSPNRLTTESRPVNVTRTTSVDEPIRRAVEPDRSSGVNRRSDPAELIVESEIGEVPYELVPAEVSVSPTTEPASDWSDVVPSESTEQTPPSSEEPASEAAPSQDELDIPESFDPADSDFLTPQI